MRPDYPIDMGRHIKHYIVYGYIENGLSEKERGWWGRQWNLGTYYR